MHDEAMILKHPLRVRIFHYFLIISFLPLAVTGCFFISSRSPKRP
jgi:formate dehydrogenase subunit gamma